MKLTAAELQAVRDRHEDHQQYHNVLVAQQDRRALLKHIDVLEAELEAAKKEHTRLRRSIE